MRDDVQAEKSAHAEANSSTIARDSAPHTPTTPTLSASSASSPSKQQNDLRPHSRGGTHSSPRAWLNNLRRPKTAPGQGQRPPPPFFARSLLNDDARRDSALQPTGSTPTTTAPSTITDSHDATISPIPSLPAIVVHDSTLEDANKLQIYTATGSNGPVTENVPSIDDSKQPSTSFSGITMAIPTGGFEDLTSPDRLQFSKRGSMLLNGKKAAQFTDGTTTPKSPSIQSQSLRPDNGSRTSLGRQSRILSPDETELSQRVRSMYEFGNERGVNWSERTVLDDAVKEEEEEESEAAPVSSPPSQTATLQKPKERSPKSKKRSSAIPWEAHEAAGGLEDWQDVAGDEVDRYGFIMPKKTESHGSNNSGSSPQLMRVSTALVELSETPRRKRTIRRSASHGSPRREAGVGLRRKLSKSSRNSLRPPASIYSTRSASSMGAQQNPMRYASNRLPHNKERRLVDEASDMLTLPPGLEDLAVAKEGGKVSAAMRKKELQREEKWRKMGKISQKSSTQGEGMLFDFDPKDPKVISRTWKGIPDKWRGSAWYSFLAASAKKHSGSQSDEELIEEFHALQNEGSPDDVQIDCDVPRTINRHIMFRRRYRGGQRLLFRVLHALSLYFPDNGYVQGMAAITATLLCYYDEEHTFIMMVRLWQLRGLDRLYVAGFEGLMEALEDFEKNWLRGNDVAKKLEELGITSTAYGTRWYLTMFNYSIPFPAQLRVWDAFMLLGDVANSTKPDNKFGADLDVLHATSAALVDATREILLDSDFENAMKVLTSWIPVKDENMMMKVAFAEWKQRKKRA